MINNLLTSYPNRRTKIFTIVVELNFNFFKKIEK